MSLRRVAHAMLDILVQNALPAICSKLFRSNRRINSTEDQRVHICASIMLDISSTLEPHDPPLLNDKGAAAAGPRFKLCFISVARSVVGVMESYRYKEKPVCFGEGLSVDCGTRRCGRGMTAMLEGCTDACGDSRLIKGEWQQEE